MNQLEAKAEDFPAWDQLRERQRALLARFWDAEDGARAVHWDHFTVEHDDRAAAFLAITGALSKTAVFGPASGIGTALDLVEAVTGIGRDRVLTRLRSASFEDWKRAGARFTIFLANGFEESGSVAFNRGDMHGSLHEGYDIQGYTSACYVPRIHWNYRYADASADIDLDGYPPIRWEHLTDQNSDVRCWYEAYVLKFGNPGFTVGVRPPEPWVRTLRP